MVKASVAPTKRHFLKLSIVGVGGLFAAWNGCEKKRYDTLTLLQKDLFPDIGDSVSIEAVNAREYASYILHHPRINDDEKKFIKNALVWLDEEAKWSFGKQYAELETKQRNEVLEQIAKTSWGESLIETVLTYIFEALLGDPVYGINKNEVGWKWLKYQAGLPRPYEAFEF